MNVKSLKESNRADNIIIYNSFKKLFWAISNKKNGLYITSGYIL